MQTIISVISSITALVAVIVGPIVTLKVARQNLLVPTEYKWIDGLREAVSELLGVGNRLHIFHEIGDDKSQELHQQLVKDETRIRLFLDPTISKHKELENAIAQYINLFVAGRTESEAEIIGALEEDITRITSQNYCIKTIVNNININLTRQFNMDALFGRCAPYKCASDLRR